MNDKIKELILKIIRMIEYFLAVLLTLAIIIVAIQMFIQIISLVGQPLKMNHFEEILSGIFSLIIGVEFIKLLCHYTTENVIEILLLTVARYLVVNHSSAINSLLGVLAIAIIFGTKKYLME